MVNIADLLEVVALNTTALRMRSLTVNSKLLASSPETMVSFSTLKEVLQLLETVLMTSPNTLVTPLETVLLTTCVETKLQT